jgi:hypothetical protein
MHHELSNLDIVNEAIDFRQQRCALAIARRQSLPNRVISLFQSVALSNLSLSLSLALSPARTASQPLSLPFAILRLRAKVSHADVYMNSMRKRDSCNRLLRLSGNPKRNSIVFSGFFKLIQQNPNKQTFETNSLLRSPQFLLL